MDFRYREGGGPKRHGVKHKIGQHRDNTAPDKCNEVTGARQRCPVPSLDWHQSSLRTLGDNTQGDDQSLRKSHDSDEEPEVSAIIGESAVQQFSETQWAEIWRVHYSFSFTGISLLLVRIVSGSNRISTARDHLTLKGKSCRKSGASLGDESRRLMGE